MKSHIPTGDLTFVHVYVHTYIRTHVQTVLKLRCLRREAEATKERKETCMSMSYTANGAVLGSMKYEYGRCDADAGQWRHSVRWGGWRGPGLGVLPLKQMKGGAKS